MALPSESLVQIRWRDRTFYRQAKAMSLASPNQLSRNVEGTSVSKKERSPIRNMEITKDTRLLIKTVKMGIYHVQS